MFYPALLGGALGCGVLLALSYVLEVLSTPVLDFSWVGPAALVTSAPVLCLLSVVTWLLAFVLPWIAPALTAPAIVRERELGTLDLLRATLLTERSIVLGKLGVCLARLWPGLLTLALLTPVQIVWVAGSGLFSPFNLSTLAMVGSLDDRWMWVWLGVSGVVSMFRPWGDLALHAAIGLFVSALSRSSGMAVAVSYGAVLVARVVFWLATSIFATLPLLLLDPVGFVDSEQAAFDLALAAQALMPLAMVFFEVAGAALLVWGAIWWLKRT
jgi:ABC-type transport system involved in multi-copper enzyme maturation permease subunit